MKIIQTITKSIRHSEQYIVSKINKKNNILLPKKYTTKLI